ncbi:hypothetical protein D7Z54_19280 [Salibacterium salarium]|uniref:Uncharacterized protein n=1 Tax=Salibacterium salarium TaxID=284579 RepID=A0A428N043_9BACI|nr:hypothetical protein [Salibacterium salarium]RSL31770.1 hypothetical protein D7Z54_19280 [Salibacterium salarium]
MVKDKTFKFFQYVGDISLFFVLGFYIVPFCLIFHLGWAVNIIAVDGSYEEHVTMPFQDYIFYFLLGSIVLYLYIRYLFGNPIYKMVKIVILMFLLGFSFLSGAVELIIMILFFKNIPAELYISQLTMFTFSLLLFAVITKRHRGIFLSINE